MVATGGSLRVLLLAFPALGLGAGAALALARRLPRPRPPDPAARGLASPGVPLRVAGLLAGLAALARYAFARDAVELWWLAVLLLGAAALLTRSAAGPSEAAPPRARGSGEAALFALAVACALLALFWHRPDLDDAFYVNIAVAAADQPGRPLLAFDTLRGIPDLPFSNPTQRAQSYELLNGALSYLLGIPAIACFHLLSAAGAAFLLPLAQARLLRLLVPRHWPFALAVVLLVTFAAGDTHRAYGNLGLVRIWQGKAIFLSAGLPLIYAYALRFARRGDAASFGLLAAAQTAAVGLTSTALWAAPLAAGLALCAGLRPDLAGLRRLALGAAASGYVLAVALALRRRVPGALAAEGGAGAPGVALHEMFASVLGGGAFELVAVAAILLAWTCLRPGIGQRFAILVPLGALLLVANPYAEALVGANLTGRTQWRAMWALPVPLLVSFLCLAPLELGARIPGPRVRAAASAALVALLLLLVPRHTALRAPGAHLHWPGLKVDPFGFAWASRIRAAVPPGAKVLAPSQVDVWLPTLHHHPYPLEVRPDFHWDLPEEDARLRFALTRYVGGELRLEGAAELLRSGILRYGIAAVCFARSEWSGEIREALEEAGFRPAGRDRFLELWLPRRSPAPGPQGEGPL